MAIVVVGGQTRNIGKTSVIAAIIAALPQMNWTAFKVTQHQHGNSAAFDAEVSITEESNSSGTTDTARFLRAGAVRSFLVQIEPGKMALALPRILQELAAAENAIFESNSILHVLKADLYLSILDAKITDCKSSTLEFIDRADAILRSGPENKNIERWPEPQRQSIRQKPQFPVNPPNFMSPELKKFITERLPGIASARS